jgi:ABC-type transport system involved in multi-copper enzyme maturation permease subunit
MLPGPIFRREVKAGASRPAIYLMRIALAALLGAIAVLGLAQLTSGATPWTPTLLEHDSVRNRWSAIFAISMGLQAVFLVLIAALAVSSSITEERERNTLPQLLLTRLTRFELVATKLLGRLMPTYLLMLAGLPLVCMSAWNTGIPSLLLLEIVGALVISIAVAGSLGILASAVHAKTSVAQGETIVWTTFWLVGFPMLSRIPAQSGTLAGELLVEIRRVASWLAPASPISLLTDFSWFTARSSADALAGRLALMIALQLLLFALAICAAVASLRLLEPHARSWDPHHGYRPPVGDDPIFWREYVLPWRGSRAPAIVVRIRYLWILIRGLFSMLVQFAVQMFSVVLPLSLAGWVLWSAFRAFTERIAQGSGPGTIVAERENFNLCIRAVTGILGVFPATIPAASLADLFTRERDKNTWDALLSTSLTGRDILWGKTKVMFNSVWPAIRCVIPLWALGIACDGVAIAGVLSAAIALAVLLGTATSLGTWLAIRPGATKRSTTSLGAYLTIFLLLIGIPLVVGPLGSARQFSQFMDWPPFARWAIVSVFFAVLVSAAFVAQSLSRRCYANFDRWSGRPYRAPGAPEAGENLATDEHR